MCKVVWYSARCYDSEAMMTNALYVVMDPLIFTHRARLSALALGKRLPTVHNLREGAEAGGLMSYGPNFPKQFRRAADMVDKVCAARSPPKCQSSSRRRSSL
jgi:putative tryptophan/tyrosine transport system substrate-binding protein